MKRQNMKGLALAVGSLLMGGAIVEAAAGTLVGYASLPAATFEPGPTSAQFVGAGPFNGVSVPFDDQPVQGFSAVLNNGDGSFLVMQDNGYGAKANSADALLRFYTIRPDFRTGIGGTGNVAVESYTTLSDPNSKVNFQIVADQTNYPGSAIPVDPSIQSSRLLTGADFDLESVRRVSDGTLWFGDEFGPFLIHTNAAGEVLEAPIPLPNFNPPAGDANPLVQSDSNPFIPAGSGNLPNSKGFEGMALSQDGSMLYPLLEGPLKTEADKTKLVINEFDLTTEQYTGNQIFYRMESSGNAIGDMTAVNDHLYMVIERDGGQGATAQFKKIYLVDFSNLDANGFAAKTELVDLLDIADPDNLGGLGGGKYTMPFVTIEDVVMTDPYTLLVINDNNYPFSAGRTPNVPDNNEFALIRFDSPIGSAIPEPGTVFLLAGALPLTFRRRRA